MATLKEKGVLTYKSEVKTGTSKKGNPYSVMTFVVSCDGRVQGYDKVAFKALNDKCIDVDKIKVGQRVEVEYSINARSYTNKTTGEEEWTNDVSIFSIKAEGQSSPVVIPTPVKEEQKSVEEDFPF